MINKEKVIKGLEHCAEPCKGAWDDNNACPYMADFIKLGADDNGSCVDLLCADAIALLKALTAFKRYFDGLYGQGLEVANWHMNGATEPFDNFYDSAIEEMQYD